MTYINKTLTFNDTNIQHEDGRYVMMDWEDNIMKRCAEYICEGGGDILEIGFCMGISADYIQQQSINSHTIIENHPQVIEKLKTWAIGKSNVIIIEGDWWEKRASLGRYDGIFHDTYDDNAHGYLAYILPIIANSGAKCTYWGNPTERRILDDTSDWTTTFEDISVSPDENDFYSDNIYKMPKVQF